MARNLYAISSMPRYARWWMFGLIGSVVVVMVVGAIVVVVKTRSMTAPTPAAFQRGEWQAPPQAVLTSPMRVPPISGWRTSTSNLGLPDDSAFAIADEPHPSSTPFIGTVGSNGYFLASRPVGADRQWWLVGIDVRTGKQLFPPVTIVADYVPACFLNGLEQVLCIADDVRGDATESTAWIIDTHTGNVSFNGPTKLHTTPGSGVSVEQVGIYAVANIRDEGAYGIGPHAQTTWFVPHAVVGSTRISGSAIDTAPPTLAAGSDTAVRDRMIIFSVVDGKVMTPQLGDGLTPQAAVVYPGGFAIQAVADISKHIPDRVMFFDDEGNRVGQTDVSGNLSIFSTVVPIIEGLPDSSVFGANGAGLIQFPDRELGRTAVVIGHRLYAPESEWEGPVKVRRWRQFDLTTGQEGTACRPNMSYYIANDGNVGVFETARYDVTGATTFAMDLDTCEKLWSTPVNPDSFHRLWRIDDTLVELSDDGKELHSLVAPA